MCRFPQACADAYIPLPSACVVPCPSGTPPWPNDRGGSQNFTEGGHISLAQSQESLHSDTGGASASSGGGLLASAHRLHKHAMQVAHIRGSGHVHQVGSIELQHGPIQHIVPVHWAGRAGDAPPPAPPNASLAWDESDASPTPALAGTTSTEHSFCISASSTPGGQERHQTRHPGVCLWAVHCASSLSLVAGFWGGGVLRPPLPPPLAVRSSSSISLDSFSQGSQDIPPPPPPPPLTEPSTEPATIGEHPLELLELASVSLCDLHTGIDIVCIPQLSALCIVGDLGSEGGILRCCQIRVQLLLSDGRTLETTLQAESETPGTLTCSNAQHDACSWRRCAFPAPQGGVLTAEGGLHAALLPVRSLAQKTLQILRGASCARWSCVAGQSLVWNGGGVSMWPSGGTVWSTSDSLPPWAHALSGPGGLSSDTSVQHLIAHREAEVLTCVVPCSAPWKGAVVEGLLLLCTTHRLVLLQLQAGRAAPPLVLQSMPLTPALAQCCPLTLGCQVALPTEGWLSRPPTFAADGCLIVAAVALSSGSGHSVAVLLTRPISSAEHGVREASAAVPAVDSSMVRFSESLSFSQDAPPAPLSARVSGVSSLGETFALSMSPFSPSSEAAGSAAPPSHSSPDEVGGPRLSGPEFKQTLRGGIQGVPSAAEIDDILGESSVAPVFGGDGGDSSGRGAAMHCDVPLLMDMAFSSLFRVPSPHGSSTVLAPSERVTALLPAPREPGDTCAGLLLSTSAGRLVLWQLLPPPADTVHEQQSPPQLQVQTAGVLSSLGAPHRRIWGGVELLQTARGARHLVRGALGSQQLQIMSGGVQALNKLLSRSACFGGTPARKRWAGRVWAGVSTKGGVAAAEPPPGANASAAPRYRAREKVAAPKQLPVPSTTDLEQIPAVPTGSLLKPLVACAGAAWAGRQGWRARLPGSDTPAELQAWTLHALLGADGSLDTGDLMQVAVVAASGLLPGTPRTGGSRQLLKQVDEVCSDMNWGAVHEGESAIAALAKWANSSLKSSTATLSLPVPLLQMEHRPETIPASATLGLRFVFRCLQLGLFQSQFPAVRTCAGSARATQVPLLLSVASQRSSLSPLHGRFRGSGAPLFFNQPTLRMLGQAAAGLLATQRLQLPPVMGPLLAAWDKLCSVFRFTVLRATQGGHPLTQAHRARDALLCLAVATSRVHVAAAVAAMQEEEGGEGGVDPSALIADAGSDTASVSSMVGPSAQGKGGLTLRTTPYHTRSVSSADSHSAGSSRSVSASISAASSVSRGVSASIRGGSISATSSKAALSAAASLGDNTLHDNDSRAGDFDVEQGAAGGDWASVASDQPEVFGGGWGGVDDSDAGRPPPPTPSATTHPLDRWLALVPAPPSAHRELSRGAPQSRQAVRHLGGLLRATGVLSQAAVDAMRSVEQDLHRCISDLGACVDAAQSSDAGDVSVQQTPAATQDDAQAVLRAVVHWSRCLQAVAPSLVPLSACSEQLHIESVCVAAAGEGGSAGVLELLKQGVGGVPTLDIVSAAASAGALVAQRTAAILDSASTGGDAVSMQLFAGDDAAADPEGHGPPPGSGAGGGPVIPPADAISLVSPQQHLDDACMTLHASGTAPVEHCVVQSAFDFKSALFGAGRGPLWWVQLSHSYGATDEACSSSTPAQVFAVMRNTAGAMGGERLFRLVSNGGRALHSWAAATVRFGSPDKPGAGGQHNPSTWSTSDATSGVEGTLALLQRKLGGAVQQPLPAAPAEEGSVGGVKRHRAASSVSLGGYGSDASDSFDALRGGSSTVASSTLADWLPGACAVPALAARVAVRASAALGTHVSPLDVIKAAEPASSGLGVLCLCAEGGQHAASVRSCGWYHLVFLAVRPAASPVPTWQDRWWDSGMGSGGWVAPWEAMPKTTLGGVARAQTPPPAAASREESAPMTPSTPHQPSELPVHLAVELEQASVKNTEVAAAAAAKSRKSYLRGLSTGGGDTLPQTPVARQTGPEAAPGASLTAVVGPGSSTAARAGGGAAAVRGGGMAAEHAAAAFARLPARGGQDGQREAAAVTGDGSEAQHLHLQPEDCSVFSQNHLLAGAGGAWGARRLLLWHQRQRGWRGVHTKGARRTAEMFRAGSWVGSVGGGDDGTLGGGSRKAPRYGESVASRGAPSPGSMHRVWGASRLLPTGQGAAASVSVLTGLAPISDAVQRAILKQEQPTAAPGGQQEGGATTPVVGSVEGGSFGAQGTQGTASAELLVVGTALSCDDVEALMEGWLQ